MNKKHLKKQFYSNMIHSQSQYVGWRAISFHSIRRFRCVGGTFVSGSFFSQQVVSSCSENESLYSFQYRLPNENTHKPKYYIFQVQLQNKWPYFATLHTLHAMWLYQDTLYAPLGFKREEKTQHFIHKSQTAPTALSHTKTLVK